MKHFKKLFSIFLIIMMLTGFYRTNDEYNTLSDTNQPPNEIEITIEE